MTDDPNFPRQVGRKFVETVPLFQGEEDIVLSLTDIKEEIDRLHGKYPNAVLQFDIQGDVLSAVAFNKSVESDKDYGNRLEREYENLKFKERNLGCELERIRKILQEKTDV